MARPEVNRRHFLLGTGGAVLAAAAPATSAAAAAGQNHATLRLDAYALCGAGGATLHLMVTPANWVPDSLSRVQVSVTAPRRQAAVTTTYHDVATQGGLATVPLGDVPELSRVVVQVTATTPSGSEVATASTAATQFALDFGTVVVPDFQGYGGQMNMHLYTALNDPARGFTGNEPPQDVGNVEAKIVAMRPALVRIFLSPTNYEPDNQNRMDSFVKTVQLAQRAGSTVNITWWFIRRALDDDPVQQQALMHEDMTHFADTLVDLIQTQGLSAVQQITIQNEVNTSWITPELYEQYYRLLDSLLHDAGIRGQVKFVGGDLVHNNQETWFTYLADHMGDILDGWSVHIYWNYWDTAYMQTRLADVKSIIDAIPEDRRKPLSITEFGVRGMRFYDNDTSDPILDVNPYRKGALTPTLAGYYEDADDTLTPISETTIDAFQHAWFNLQAAQMGFAGLAKWDLYRAQYDFSYQDHSTIGYLFDPEPSQDRWPLRPVYHLQALLSNTTAAHWKVLRCTGTAGASLVSAYAGPSGAMTVCALSTDGAAASFSIGELPERTTFRLVRWNATGDGTLSFDGAIGTGDTGTIAVDAPAQSMVCLTTLPVDAALMS